MTGRLWRKDNLNDLPFYSNIAKMEDIAETLVEIPFKVAHGGHGGWLVVSILLFVGLRN